MSDQLTRKMSKGYWIENAGGIKLYCYKIRNNGMSEIHKVSLKQFLERIGFENEAVEDILKCSDKFENTSSFNL